MSEVQTVRRHAVAYYRHSVQHAATTSLAHQQKQVRQFAHEQGIEIIKEFVDCGKDGANIEERDGLAELIENWVKTSNGFRFVLCLDASRWGRFHELTRHLTAQCNLNGKEVLFASGGTPNQRGSLSNG